MARGAALITVCSFCVVWRRASSACRRTWISCRSFSLASLKMGGAFRHLEFQFLRIILHLSLRLSQLQDHFIECPPQVAEFILWTL